MRFRLASAVAIVALAVPALAHAQPSAERVEADNALFLKLTTEVQGAVQQKNTAALDAHFAKDFAFSMLMAGKPPQVLNREEFLKMGALYTLERFELKNLAARVLGSVAVVRFQSLRKAELGTLDRSGEFVVVDTWVKDGSSWRLAMRFLARPDPGLAAAQ
jgi:hypothetical protein